MISAINRTRLHRLVVLFAKNSFTQVWIQGCSLVAGLLLLRILSTKEYALYSIASGYQGVLAVLSDLALSMSITAFGGTEGHRSQRLGSVVQSALRLRWSYAGLAFLVMAPIHWVLLTRQQSGAWYAVLLLVPPSLAIISLVQSSILGTSLRVLDRYDTVFRTDAAVASTRPVLTGGLALTSPTAIWALALNSLTVAAGAWIYRREARAVGLLSPVPPSRELEKKMVRLSLQAAPTALFYCIQGQLPLWIIAIFGLTQNVAEVGALSRLGLIIGLGISFVSTVLAPKFARQNSIRRLHVIFGGTVAIGSAGLAAIWLVAVFLPKPLLLILGPNFKHLGPELIISVGAQCISGLTSIMFALTSSRGWIRLNWMYIPLTIVTQIIAVTQLPLTSTIGVLWFQLVCTIPAFGLNILIYFDGIRKFVPSPPAESQS